MSISLEHLAAYARAHESEIIENASFDPELYNTFGVKRGLRDKNGKGVMAGLTGISEIESSKTVNGENVPCEGRLWYRGYDMMDLVNGVMSTGRFGSGYSSCPGWGLS